MTQEEKIIYITGLMEKNYIYSDDVKQNVLVDIVEKMDLSNYPKETLLSLTMKLLKNKFIDEKRKQKVSFVDSDISEIDFLTFIIQEECIDMDEQEKMLQIALKSLNEKEQEVMRLILEGKKLQEIASQQNKSLNTIKSTKKRAIAKIKLLWQ